MSSYCRSLNSYLKLHIFSLIEILFYLPLRTSIVYSTDKSFYLVECLLYFDLVLKHNITINYYREKY